MKFKILISNFQAAKVNMRYSSEDHIAERVKN
jgi:hypothetical protein